MMLLFALYTPSAGDIVKVAVLRGKQPLTLNVPVIEPRGATADVRGVPGGVTTSGCPVRQWVRCVRSAFDAHQSWSMIDHRF